MILYRFYTETGYTWYAVYHGRLKHKADEIVKNTLAFSKSEDNQAKRWNGKRYDPDRWIQQHLRGKSFSVFDTWEEIYLD